MGGSGAWMNGGDVCRTRTSLPLSSVIGKCESKSMSDTSPSAGGDWAGNLSGKEFADCEFGERMAWSGRMWHRRAHPTEKSGSPTEHIWELARDSCW